ncbi:hypothetical protein TR66_31530 [Streptomyces sp. WM6391]|nr:hypothetical protein TR66_31530 [Streptomyces sp. WM6391]
MQRGGGRYGPLRGSAGGGLGESAAVLRESMRPDRAWRAGGIGRIEADAGLHGVAAAAEIVDSLSGPAGTVTLRLAEPVQPRIARDGLELLANQEPVGEVAGDGGGEGGDEAVFLVVAEGEMGGGMQGGGVLLTWSVRGRQ